MVDTNGNMRDSSVCLDSKRLGGDQLDFGEGDFDPDSDRLSKHRLMEIMQSVYKAVARHKDVCDVTIELDELLSVLHEVNEHREIIGPLSRLMQEADATVSFVGTTPNRNLKRGSIRDGGVSIVVSNDKTDWEPKAIQGASYAEAIGKAMKYAQEQS